MTLASTHSSEFSIGQARAIVRDLFEPNMDDLLYRLYAKHSTCAYVVFIPRDASVVDAGARRHTRRFANRHVFMCGLCYFRAAFFIHELAHFPAEKHRAFRMYWNWLAGTKMLLPSFLYEMHDGHHRRKSYGTRDDGEYVPFPRRSRRDLLLYVVQPFIVPILAVIRFFILAPLSWFSPWLRTFLYEHASSLVVNPAYIRPAPPPRVLRSIRIQEIQCFNTCWIAALVLVLFLHEYAWALLLNVYLLAVFVLAMNHTRALVSHRWTGDEHEMTFVEQMLDSANYPDGYIVHELWAPVGTRYHALHHLFPSMPYHHLPEAHRRLMEKLPIDSPYRKTVYPSMLAVLLDTFRSAGQQTPAIVGHSV